MKGHILYDSMSMGCPDWAGPERERLVVARDWEEGRVERG